MTMTVTMNSSTSSTTTTFDGEKSFRVLCHIASSGTQTLGPLRPRIAVYVESQKLGSPQDLL